MEKDQERVELAKDLFTNQEVVKTSIGFKKGMIAGILVLVLILCIGILIGYGLGINAAASHYSDLLLECKESCLSTFLFK